MTSTETRRSFLRIAAAAALPTPANAHDHPTIPQTAEELWKGFDPRQDPLEVEQIREWREDGAVFQHVRFLVGTFRGNTARMTAIYGFPESFDQRLPAVMHIHGGGQRAFLHEVQFLVGRGYAALSVNWGGNGDGEPPFNSVDGALPGDPNTDWGIVDPSQLNATAYDSILPGPKQLFPNHEHPQNCNWYLLTLACRRGLTFLEQQPQVDPLRLGVHGYSMGGNLTMYVAATDDRVKAAVPAVGGAGYRWEWHDFHGGKARLDHVRGDVDLFRRTLSFESYAPMIRCPVLHRSATNDFHGWMDDVYRTNALIQNQPTRYSWAVHFNHRLTPEVEVSMPLWFDQHLKGGPAIPDTPVSHLILDAADHTPVLHVTPDHRWEIARCSIFYSVDPDPRARFWRSAPAIATGGSYSARLPLHAVDTPLFAFAGIDYRLPEPISAKPLPGHREPFTELRLCGLLHSTTPEHLREAGITAAISPSPLIDDFSNGLSDWYVLNRGNRSHQQLWTRKLTDPLYRGADRASLELTLRIPESNVLTFVVVQNEWRNYRGPKQTFVLEREITGSTEPQVQVLRLEDFQSMTDDQDSLRSWSQVDLFGICSHFSEQRQPAAPVRPWRGSEPDWLRLQWV